MKLGGPLPTTQQLPEDVADILQPTSTRYTGPIDLDKAVAQRFEAINASWMASAGAHGISSDGREGMEHVSILSCPGIE